MDASNNGLQQISGVRKWGTCWGRTVHLVIGCTRTTRFINKLCCKVKICFPLNNPIMMMEVMQIIQCGILVVSFHHMSQLTSHCRRYAFSQLFTPSLTSWFKDNCCKCCISICWCLSVDLNYSYTPWNKITIWSYSILRCHHSISVFIKTQWFKR